MSNDDIVAEFLAESGENLDQLDRDFVALEAAPHDRDRIASIFRTIHTIKGTCGFLGFARLEALTHAGESVLSLLRDGTHVLTPEVTTTLLAMVDAVRASLATIAATGLEEPVDHVELLDELARWQLGAGPRPVVPAAAAATVPREVAGRTAGCSETIRVDVAVLDALMNVVGELVLARNQIVQHATDSPDAGVAATAQRVNLITAELQEGVMKMRMQPIGNIWNKLPRVVRDLSLDAGKQVRLTMEGQETELDRTVIEAIKDPLVHLVRNAVDHGLEPPDARVAAGKPAQGTIYLTAYHEGGQVNIELRDDGAGIDPQRVRERAVSRGILTREEALRLGNRESLGLIYAPGFSTASKVTNVSGRGVGLDVVKTNIEKLGGLVEVQSEVGRGTTFKLKIPLTLAIIPALVVTCDGDRYAIPQVSLIELVHVEPDSDDRIEDVEGAPVYRLRGKLLPILRLRELMGLAPADLSATGAHIVVLQADGRRFGLVVDEIIDTEEIVVKPLGAALKTAQVYTGATIMGDGRVALILDVFGIAQKARLLSGAKGLGVDDSESVTRTREGERHVVLLAGIAADRRVGIPLEHVTRLETFPIAGLELAGDRTVVQYRGEILPLVWLGHALGKSQPAVRGSVLPVVVCGGQPRVGLVVDRIIDVVDDTFVLRRPEVLGGPVAGSAILQGRVTDIVDLEVLRRPFGRSEALEAA